MNILVAIRWVALAWSQVAAETISKCFRKTGILDEELDVVNRGEVDLDPFIEADERMELEGLIDNISDSGCTVDEFLTGDSDLAVCVEMDDDNWDTTFLEELGEDQSEEIDRIESDEEDDQEEPPKLKSYKEAIVSWKKCQDF